MKKNEKKTNQSAAKKMISAVGMLAVSVVTLSTSTFAWFSLNKEVTAGTMSISAKSDNPFLQIKVTGAAGDFATAATFTATGTELELVTPTSIGTTMAWGHAYSSDPSQSQGDKATTPLTLTAEAAGETATLLKDANSNCYVLQQNLDLRVVENAGNGTNLKVNKVAFNAGTNSIAASGRLLVVNPTSGDYQLFKVVTGDVSTIETGSATSLIATMTAGAEYTLNTYFYFDGTDTSAYTNNATDLTGITADITFGIE